MRGKRVLKWILLAFSTVVGLSIITFGIIYYNTFVITILDRPWILSGKRETIEVVYINWACDCADFIELRNYNQDSLSGDDQYIFIEYARSELKLPDNFYEKEYRNKKLRLTGQYYLDKGISESYELKTPVKPDKAKVFRYNKIEILNRDN